jgi:putative transposase
MAASALKRMHAPEEENRQLKKMFADLTLENRALKDVLKKNWIRVVVHLQTEHSLSAVSAG